MATNPKFDALLADMQAMHDKKSQDYASDANRYANFEEAGAVAAGFTNPIDITFAVLIGVKLARLKELKGKGKTPNNESVLDTQLDLAVYAALWASYDYPVKAAPMTPDEQLMRSVSMAALASPGCACSMCNAIRKAQALSKGELFDVLQAGAWGGPAKSPR